MHGLKSALLSEGRFWYCEIRGKQLISRERMGKLGVCAGSVLGVHIFIAKNEQFVSDSLF